MGGDKRAGGGGEVAKEELQAIVLADSFSGSFRPCSLEVPKVLLPLLNVPMLDYVMEFLVASGVQEIFIFCVNKRDKVQEYVAASKWASMVSVRCVTGPKCTGAGDALREMDRTGLIRSNPFIVISGDVVGTVNLEAVVAGHKRRRADNALNIMTVVLAKVGYEAGVRPRLEDLVVGLDARTQQILAYEDDGDEGHESRVVAVQSPLELVKEGHREVTMRNDLQDCHIYVCSPEVLVSFSDNWDYQELPRFIRNEVQNREMGNRLYGHVLDARHEYAARVHDPHVYHRVSEDLMARWMYPLVPDHNNMRWKDSTSYRYQRRWLYKEEQVNVSRSAVLGKAVMLGKGTSIGANSRLEGCTVGRDVRIGSNVRISHSHIFDHVTIHDNAVIEYSMVCDGVVVKEGAVVPRGCMLSYHTVIGQAVTLPPFTRIHNSPPQPPKVEVVGVDGVGRAWLAEYDGERVPEATLRAQAMGATEGDEQRAQRHMHMPEESEEEEEDDDVEEDYGMGSLHLGGGAGSGPNGRGGGGGGSMSGSEAADAFCASVVHDMLVSGWASRHPVSNSLLEVKSFKFAQNKSFAEMSAAVLPALLDLSFYPEHTVESNRLLHSSSSSSGGPMSPAKGSVLSAVPPRVPVKPTEALANLKEQLNHWKTLLRALNQEEEVEEALLGSMEAYALRDREGLYPVFGIALVTLIQMEVVKKPAALRWVSCHESLGVDSEASVLFHQDRTAKFVSWLRDYDSEDEEEESSEEDESDDESDEEEED